MMRERGRKPLVGASILIALMFLLPATGVLADNTDQQISLGSAEDGSLSGSGAKDYYYFTLGSDYTGLTVQTYDTGSGYDFDLYVKRGGYPTTSDYDGRGYTNSANEQITFNDPQSGTYYVMVLSYSGSGTYSLIATGEGGAQVATLTSGVAGSSSLGGTGEEKYFSIDVTTATSLTVVTDGPGTADYDLYVKKGSMPTTSSYDGRGYTGSADETVTISNPSSGTYYVMVKSYSGSGSFTVTATAYGGDTEPPSIGAISATSITPYGATITWTTDEASSSMVEYGTTTAYGSVASGSSGVTSHSVALTGLSPGTTYHYRVKSMDAATNTATSSDKTFATENVGDTTPPVLSSISASSITTNTATIGWTTDEASSSVVEYGTTTAYGYSKTGSNGVTSHSVSLNALSAATTYHYRVRSTDESGNTGTSSDRTFATTSGDTTTEIDLGIWSGYTTLSGPGDKDYYKVYLDANYDSLVAQTEATGSGYDFDLYVKYGSLPSTSSYDARGYTNSAAETVTISDPNTGWYYIMVNSYSGSGEYRAGVYITGGPSSDTTAPELSSISSSPSETSCTITWTTNEASSSVVEYGTTTAYGYSKTGSSGVTSHSVSLTGLSAGTLYHYRVRSTDEVGNTATSSDKTFSTTGGSGPAQLILDGDGLAGSLSGQGDKEYYYVTIPSGKATLTVETYGAGTGYDFDLYVKLGSTPTTSSHDGKGYTGSSNEVVTLTNPVAGTYYIMVNSYSGSGSFNVRAKSTEQGGGGGSKLALCIGISDYRYISDLSYCDEDADDWESYLQGEGYTVTKLINSQATEVGIYNAIDNLIAAADSDTWVVITFSGHGGFQSEGGYSSSAGTQHWGQVDGHPSQCHAWDSDGYGYGCILDNVLAYKLRNLQSNHVLLFLDSCRSGGMDEIGYRTSYSEGSTASCRYMAQTCGWNEYGYDAPQHNNGAWTYWFLEWAVIGQGYSSFETAFSYAAPRYTNEYSDSHPEQEDHFSGPFMV
ncbi:MAG: pre-peptidase C-terminal domain-containing protein [Thermoplasmata archaeon]|nr:pre-peptidase C-terminal domain-containing protein [Thermoplasmata archaeon]